MRGNHDQIPQPFRWLGVLAQFSCNMPCTKMDVLFPVHDSFASAICFRQFSWLGHLGGSADKDVGLSGTMYAH